MANIVIGRYAFCVTQNHTRIVSWNTMRNNMCNRKDDTYSPLIVTIIIHNYYKQRTFTNALCIGVKYLRPIWILHCN